MYGDVEKIITGWLGIQMPAVRFCTELPAVLPVKTVRVIRFGGARQIYPFDAAHIDVDCFAPTRLEAHDLAESVAVRLIYILPGFVSDDGTGIVTVENFSAPSWGPYENPAVRRCTASYLVRTVNNP